MASSGDDGYGNKTTGSIAQAYDVIKGQAKLATSKTDSNTTNLDGSSQQQNLTVSYKYDASTFLRILAHAGLTVRWRGTSDDGRFLMVLAGTT